MPHYPVSLTSLEYSNTSQCLNTCFKHLYTHSFMTKSMGSLSNSDKSNLNTKEILWGKITLFIFKYAFAYLGTFLVEHVFDGYYWTRH